MISRWPPLIIAKDSDDAKYEPAGFIVIVSLPALIRSGSYFPRRGKGPAPINPF